MSLPCIQTNCYSKKVFYEGRRYVKLCLHQVALKSSKPIQSFWSVRWYYARDCRDQHAESSVLCVFPSVFKFLTTSITEIAAMLWTLMCQNLKQIFPSVILRYPRYFRPVRGKVPGWGHSGAPTECFCCVLPSGVVSFSIKWLERGSGWLH